MTALVDTNVLIAICAGTLGQSLDITIQETGVQPVLVVQVLAEFWAVVTRPIAVNGHGLSPHEARILLDKFCSLIPVVSEPDSVTRTWLDLVTRYEVKGKQTHDAKIVASMLSLGITHILTLNPQDFARYPEITTITP